MSVIHVKVISCSRTAVHSFESSPPPSNRPPVHPPARPPNEQTQTKKGCVYLNTAVDTIQGTRGSSDRDSRGSERAVANSDDESKFVAYGEGKDVGTDADEDQPRVRLSLAGGGEVLAHTAVVATEAPAAVKLLGGKVLEGGAQPSKGRASTCLYFALDGPAPVRRVFF